MSAKMPGAVGAPTDDPTPVPISMVLASLANYPPTLTSEPSFGTAAVWTDQTNAINIASDIQDPPWTPEVVNASWQSSLTPGIAVAPSWNDMFIAWTDQSTGSVFLSSVSSGWESTTTLLDASTGVSSGSGIALAFSVSDDTLYFAFQDNSGNLQVGTYTQTGTFNLVDTQFAVQSRPSLMVEPGKLWVLTGGDELGAGGESLTFQSTDGGQTFASVTGPQYLCAGPPAMLRYGDGYYVILASSKDQNELDTYFFQSSSFESPDEILFSNQCHSGGPALSLSTAGNAFTLGWLVGSTDNNLHHIAIGQIPYNPLPPAMTQADYFATERGKKVLERCSIKAQDPCAGQPGTIYNPSDGQCVPRGGCTGGCVAAATTPSKGPEGYIFSVFSFAICMIGCAVSSTKT